MRKPFRLIILLLFSALWASAQNKEVTGKITDSTGTPIPGASVKLKGKKGGASAGADGSFRMTVPSNATLIITAIGYEPQEISVANASDIAIHLHVGGSKVLNEVVVTSLGIKREKRELTYSTQEIKGESLVAAKQDNIINGLAGKVSGVQITNSTGMPGSSSRIVIRGAVSLIGNNQPLFVVDGVPIDNTEAGAIDVAQQGADNAALNQGSSSNRAIDIDPNIIESVTVLKGAAATAIYGSAAATGAIIITTRNAASRNGKPQVSVSSSYSLADPYYYPIQTQYSQGSAGHFVNGTTQKSSTSYGAAVDTLKVNGLPVKLYNQQKLFFRTGHVTDNNVSATGATDKSKYLLSYSYLRNDGITPNTDFTRHSFFGKFSNQLSSNVTANFQMNYINSVNDRITEGNGISNPLWTVFAAPITWNPLPSTNPNGSQNLYRSPFRNNPYFVIQNSGFVSAVNRFLPTASLVYAPLPWLSITERFGGDIYSDESNYHEPNTFVQGSTFNGNGGVSNRTETYRQFNNDLIAEIHKDLSPVLKGTFLAGMNILSRNDRVYTQTGQGQNIANFYNITNFTTLTSLDIMSKYRKVGYYAQANLDYKNMLNLALTGRYDGSSVLNQNKAYYPYGSAALGFIFTELMKGNPSALSFGKVRVSYSAVGNDDLPPYSLTTPFALANGSANNILYPYSGNGGVQTGFLKGNLLGNPNLKNESLKEFETGLELKFLNNRLSFEGSYFVRKTTDLLTLVPVAPSSGYYKEQLNAGSMQDKGIEILISGTPIKTRDFSWDVLVNFTRIRNKVLKLAPGVSNIQFGGFGGGGGTYAFAGKPYGMLYGVLYKRDAKGNIVIDDDTNSSTYGAPLQADTLGIIGNTNPDFLAGISNTFTYKAFSLSFLFDWRQGGDILNLDDHYNWFYGTAKATANRAPRVVPGVTNSDGKPNTISVGGQTYWSTISNIDEASVEKGTFVKLRTASLSYSLHSESIKKTPFRSIVISLTGNNLFIYKPNFSSADPEASISGSGNGQGVTNYMTPTTRTYILGVRLGF